MAYLSGPLARFEDAGIGLVPLPVDSDGSCLPHSLSKGMMQMEVFFDLLRFELEEELRTHEEWYKHHARHGPEGHNISPTDESWGPYWESICAAASPTKGMRVGPDKYLELIHVLGFANLLARPIGLIDGDEGKVHAAAVSSGLVCPLRRTRGALVISAA
jgi:hypothetical protein